LIPLDLLERLDAYAERKGVTKDEALVLLVDAGLRAHERATSAGQKRGKLVTSDDARHAASTRWEAVAAAAKKKTKKRKKDRT
jgi:hypothetical protein